MAQGVGMGSRGGVVVQHQDGSLAHTFSTQTAQNISCQGTQTETEAETQTEAQTQAKTKTKTKTKT
jgi:NAD(P)H-dependent FMN reductase